MGSEILGFIVNRKHSRGSRSSGIARKKGLGNGILVIDFWRNRVGKLWRDLIGASINFCFYY